MKFKIAPIAGDASFRRFYRIILNTSSKIAVIAEKNKYKNLISYIAINKFLRKNKILAPKLLNYNYTKGIIVIEDFGNLTFYKLLKKKINKLGIYKKLVDLLIKIQNIKPKQKVKSINNYIHKLEKYSNQHLLEESNLFFDWYLSLFLNKKNVLNIKKKSNKYLLKLYNKLHFTNSCFVHRDYHVQNLMKVGKKVGVIDTQDAIIGHPAYDLVSLVDDVRLRTSQNLKNSIYKYYLKKNLKISQKNKNFFLEDFKILSVQRNLKILGIFSRLFIRDGKKSYLKLIPHTWQILDMRMRSEIFSDLKAIFDKNISQGIKKKIIYK